MLSPVLHLNHFIDQELQTEAVRALELLGAEGVAIALEQDGGIICRARAGEKAPGLGARLWEDAGITGECVRTASPVYCADALTDPLVDAEASRLLNVRSVLAVPLLEGGRAVGVLEALSSAPDAFRTEQRELLQFLAPGIMAIASGNMPELPHDLGDAQTSDPPIEPSWFENSELQTHAETAVEADDSPSDIQANGYDSGLDPRELAISLDPSAANWKQRLSKPLAAIAILFVVNIALIGMLWLLFNTEGKSRNVPPSATMPAKAAAATNGGASAAPVGEREAAATTTAPKAEEIALLNTWAQQGNTRAQLQLAKALAKGVGVPPDLVAGYAWYIVSGLTDNELRSLPNRMTAAQIGSVRLTVAEMFASGSGVQADLPTAYYWAQLALAAGNPAAGAESQRIGSRLSSKQLARAQTRVQKWLKSHRASAAAF